MVIPGKEQWGKPLWDVLDIPDLIPQMFRVAHPWEDPGMRDLLSPLIPPNGYYAESAKK